MINKIQEMFINLVVCNINNKQISTMKSNSGKIQKMSKNSTKIKKHQKTQQKHRKNENKNAHEDEEDDDDIILSGQQQNENNGRNEQYESVEDVRIKLAKKVIQQTKVFQKKKVNDDFFIEDVQGEEGKKQQDAVAEDLKLSYFRDRNRLYQPIQQSYFKNCLIDEPIVYKGHLKCITAIHITSQNIYSCSKDRSIIKWDRETQKKDFISLGKNQQHHTDQILCLALHHQQNLLATAGQDHNIKLWDTRNFQLIETLKGHKNSVNGIAFGGQSYTLSSISSDRTFKEWDAAQRGLIETYYGHREQGLDIDSINSADFLSSGNDRQIVAWKTEKQTQLIFEGHDYAIDRVRAINDEKFITASQDGSVYLWSQKRKKPLHKHLKAHTGWICALGNIRQSNIFATGAIDKVVNIWSIGNQMKSVNLVQAIPVDGIITDIKINREEIAFTECDEHRLGRWVTTKCRNKIKVYRFKQ